MPSASLHTEGNSLLIINKFPWHRLLINLLFCSSNYFCLFELTVSFPHLHRVSRRRCCMANATFLCPRVPCSLCSVCGRWDPSCHFLRLSHGLMCLTTCPYFTQVLVQAAPGTSWGSLQCLGNVGFPSPPAPSPGSLLNATRNPPCSSQVAVDLPTGNGGTFTISQCKAHLSIYALGSSCNSSFTQRLIVSTN